MDKKIWYREDWRPFEAGGPWLVGKELIEADVLGAEANPFGALYMVVTKNGKHDTVRQQQVIFSKTGDGKKIENTGEVYPEFPLKSKKEAFWHFMKSPLIWVSAYWLFVLALIIFIWPAAILFGLLGILPLGNLSLNYEDYKKSLKYIKE